MTTINQSPRAIFTTRERDNSEMNVNFYEEDGQMTFSTISTDTRNKVVQANPMIRGRQNLNLNQKKLVLVMIMQVLANDVEFKPFEVSPAEFSSLIGNSDSSNMYHRAKALCDSLMKKQLEILSDDGSWEKHQWVQFCRYDSKTKRMQIMLNPSLKPYLLGLVSKGGYTQYTIDNTLSMTSIHAIRIFELIQEAIRTRTLPKEGMRVRIERQTIVDACTLYKTNEKTDEILIDPATKKPIEIYPKFSHLKKYVIKPACEEICKNTNFYVPFEAEDPENPDKCVKFHRRGREIQVIDFFVNEAFHEDMFYTKDNIDRLLNTGNRFKGSA